MEILTFSKAMYSTWLYYAPDRILFDCGEGISTQLTNKLFAVKKIFLTHSHADHIAGLWGFLNTRSSAMGERDKPLEIYYHKSSELIRNYIEFILSTGNRLRYELSVHEIDTDDEIVLTEGGGRRYIKPFETDHMKREVSLGYQIRETRKRLKPEFQGFEQEAIKDLIIKNGRDYITERYSYSLLTLSGDGNVIGDTYMSDTATLIHECTFLDGEDRRGDKHTEIRELLDKIKLNKPKRVVLYHISNRYINKLRDMMKKVEKELKEEGIEFFYVYPGKVCRF